MDPVPRVWITGTWPLVDRRQAYLHFQRPRAPPSDLMPGMPQVPRHLTVTISWAFHGGLVDYRHHRQCLARLRSTANMRGDHPSTPYSAPGIILPGRY